MSTKLTGDNIKRIQEYLIENGFIQSVASEAWDNENKISGYKTFLEYCGVGYPENSELPDCIEMLPQALRDYVTIPEYIKLSENMLPEDDEDEETEEDNNEDTDNTEKENMAPPETTGSSNTETSDEEINTELNKPDSIENLSENLDKDETQESNGDSFIMKA